VRLEAEAEALMEQARNRPPNAALDRLAEALGGPQTPEERATSTAEWFYRDSAYACKVCGYVFTDGDVVHRRRHAVREGPFAIGWSLGSVCEQCVSGWHPSWTARRQEPVPCAGGCGVLVTHSQDDVWRRGADGEYDYHPAIITCSRRCSEEYARIRKRVQVGPRDCQVCGESFTPKRGDARFCSNACRQDAYRKRRLGGASA
jgi:hypothetical protein